jgi:hypothetical protein
MSSGKKPIAITAITAEEMWLSRSGIEDTVIIVLMVHLDVTGGRLAICQLHLIMSTVQRLVRPIASYICIDHPPQYLLLTPTETGIEEPPS